MALARRDAPGVRGDRIGTEADFRAEEPQTDAEHHVLHIKKEAARKEGAATDALPLLAVEREQRPARPEIVGRPARRGVGKVVPRASAVNVDAEPVLGKTQPVGVHPPVAADEGTADRDRTRMFVHLGGQTLEAVWIEHDIIRGHDTRRGPRSREELVNAFAVAHALSAPMLLDAFDRTRREGRAVVPHANA